MNKYQLLIGVGALSGIINALLLLVPPNRYWGDGIATAVLFGAGLLYGIVTGVYFISALPLTRKYLRLLVWIIASSASYLYAVFFILSQRPILQEPLPYFSDPVVFSLGGLGGAFILTATFHFIIHKMSLLRHSIVVAAGAIIPYVLVALGLYSGDNKIFLPILYVAWQTTITTAIGLSIFSQNKKK